MPAPRGQLATALRCAPVVWPLAAVARPHIYDAEPLVCFIRKPDAVVPENRWRARVIWAGLLVSIAACEFKRSMVLTAHRFGVLTLSEL